MVLSVLLGWGVNEVLPTVEAPALAMEELVEWWSLQGICLVGLTLLFLSSLLRLGPRAFVAEVFSTDEEEDGHCHDHDHCHSCDHGEETHHHH